MPIPSRPSWTVLLAALALAVGALALAPHPPSTLDTGWDKLHHVLAFAALAFCAQHAAQGSRWPSAVWQGCVFSWGVLIELAQTQVPGRHGDWPDLLADAMGMALGVGAARQVLRRL